MIIRTSTPMIRCPHCTQRFCRAPTARREPWPGRNLKPDVPGRLQHLPRGVMDGHGREKDEVRELLEQPGSAAADAAGARAGSEAGSEKWMTSDGFGGANPTSACTRTRTTRTVGAFPMSSGGTGPISAFRALPYYHSSFPLSPSQTWKWDIHAKTPTQGACRAKDPDARGIHGRRSRYKGHT